jgi:hypothetical protein
MEKRNFCTSVVVYLFVSLVGVVLVAGCASSPQAHDERAAGESDKDAPQAITTTEAGPFEVAVDWASAVPSEAGSSETVPESVQQVVREWKIARVARVWASGEEFRAVVVQKNTARETPAALLHITRSESGHSGSSKWVVTGAEPTTSTHLWSEL